MELDNAQGGTNFPLIKKYLTHPNIQLKYSFLAAITVSICVLLSHFVLFYFLSSFLFQVYQTDAQSAAQISKLVEMSAVFSFVLFLVIFFLTFFVSILITHRFLGPMISIRRHFERLKSGDFSRPLQVRRTDEVHDLVEMINEYTHALENRQVKK